MTKDELADYLHTEAGEKLDELIIKLNSELRLALLPKAMDGTTLQDDISDWVYNRLCGLVAEADDILSPRKARPHPRAPMRKFIGGEPLTVGQTVIVDAVRRLSKVQALKLIRGAFLDDDGHECSLAEAKTINDAIMGREVL